MKILFCQRFCPKGLQALWRETFFAKKVLKDKTRGYRNHPQLHRLKKTKETLDAINFYLLYVWIEANSRNYHFGKSKFTPLKISKKSCKFRGNLSSKEIIFLKN